MAYGIARDGGSGVAERGRSRPRRWLVLAAWAGVTGCVSVEMVAPPVAGLRDGGSAGVAEGRRLYLTTCTKCHSAEPVRRYSAAEWATILPEMAEESHFTPAETAAVAAYIRAVLATPPLAGHEAN